MTAHSYPRRVRLHGGRNVHAARDLSGDGRATACDYYLVADARNEWKPNDAPITCPACLRAIAKEQQR